MTKHTTTHAGWFKKSKIQCYNSYLDKACEKGQITQAERDMYHDSTDKKNCKSLFGPISF